MTHLFTVRDPAGNFLMTAPMVVLRRVLNLHRSAEDRIREETRSTDSCEICFNGRRNPVTSEDRVYVTAVRS